VVLCGGLALAAPLARAQKDHARVAVPLYRPADAMQGLYRQVLVPRAEAFAAQAARLPAALQTHCAAGGDAASLAAARTAWVDALAAWELLATVPLGPLIERRAVRTLDFQPARPELIERAIARQPTSPADMQRIGTPAKGLPALEWLLWTRPATPQTPACTYAQRVAEELAREAQALRDAVTKAAAADWDEARGDAAFAEFINQWLGAAERLRWAQIDKPRKEAATRGKSKATFPRAASGQTAASWQRQWQVLREWAVHDGGVLPRPGQGVVPLESYLRGRGLNELADAWVARIERNNHAMQGLRTEDNKRLDAAVREMVATKALAQDKLAPALEVSIGFSDADGD
jgi:hypothetical protein